MRDIDELVGVVFAGLSPLVIEDVIDQGEWILVRARTPEGPTPCVTCGAATERVHGYYWRRLADVPIDARRVIVRVRIRRLVCPTRGCRYTFREQLPGVLERYQRRTSRLITQVGVVVQQLAGRASARLLSALAVAVSRHTALRALLRLPLPAQPVVRVIGVDDYALRRRHSYATVVTNAETNERIDVLSDRTADTLQAWLREHPGIEVVCRDGSAIYAEAIRRALPDAMQVADRWHLWRNLCDAVGSEVKAHSGCWATVLDAPVYDGPRAQTTLQRWHRIHDLLGQGVGLLECARRLQLSLNTVKRYARVENPAVPVAHLFEEIKAADFTGCMNLLNNYINQGRADAERSHISARKLTRMLLAKPDNLTDEHPSLLAWLTAACTEMTELSGHVAEFAQLLVPNKENADALTSWISRVRATNLPHLHSFTRGLERDGEAVNAALTSPYHNRGTEGVNTKTKLIKRQMYGRAGFALLRHRILLG